MAHSRCMHPHPQVLCWTPLVMSLPICSFCYLFLSHGSLPLHAPSPSGALLDTIGDVTAYVQFLLSFSFAWLTSAACALTLRRPAGPVIPPNTIPGGWHSQLGAPPTVHSGECRASVAGMLWYHEPCHEEAQASPG
eukprot:1161569-Pelagomonas_calceolata.AAC.1